MGAHRDDLEISINGMNVRTYGSQGQQRSAVLALKLSECGMIRQLTGEEPVVLLDDVMSELDESRREYLLNHMGDPADLHHLLRPQLLPPPGRWEKLSYTGGRHL